MDIATAVYSQDALDDDVVRAKEMAIAELGRLLSNAGRAEGLCVFANFSALTSMANNRCRGRLSRPLLLLQA